MPIEDWKERQVRADARQKACGPDLSSERPSFADLRTRLDGRVGSAAQSSGIIIIIQDGRSERSRKQHKQHASIPILMQNLRRDRPGQESRPVSFKARYADPAPTLTDPERSQSLCDKV